MLFRIKTRYEGYEPGYEPSNRHKIGNEILEYVYQSELDKSKKIIIGKSVCLDLVQYTQRANNLCNYIRKW